MLFSSVFNINGRPWAVQSSELENHDFGVQEQVLEVKQASQKAGLAELGSSRT